MVPTTDLHGQCTKKHSGTSASAPVLAGIIALALEANPRLTWREVQHLLVMCSNKDGLIAPDWRQNGAGNWFSHRFGFGAVDALKMIQYSKHYTLPVQKKCNYQFNASAMNIPTYTMAITTYNRPNCPTVLEHVVLETTAKFKNRGFFKLMLMSPMKTQSNLHMMRPNDTSSLPLIDWRFLSVHFWGESPWGKWSFYLREYTREKPESIDDYVTDFDHEASFNLVLYGH